jgi:hypothetical protein
MRPSLRVVMGGIALGLWSSSLVLLHGVGRALVLGAGAAVLLVEWVKLARERAEDRLGVQERIATARSLLARGICLEAHAAAMVAADMALTTATLARALELAAWSLLELGRPEEAREALRRVRPPRVVDVYCWAAVEDACGRADRAWFALDQARQAGSLAAEAIKLLIDLHVRWEEMDAACRVAREELRVLGPDDARLVLEAAFDARAFRGATELAAALFEATASLDDGIARAYGLVQLGLPERASATLARLVAVPAGWTPREETKNRLRELASRRELDASVASELGRIARGVS